jgi:hypothetical protein
LVAAYTRATGFRQLRLRERICHSLGGPPREGANIAIGPPDSPNRRVCREYVEFRGVFEVEDGIVLAPVIDDRSGSDISDP